MAPQKGKGKRMKVDHRIKDLHMGRGHRLRQNWLLLFVRLFCAIDCPLIATGE
jgi:hypothetical protein